MSPVSVSYTHLDVYKRQIENNPMIGWRGVARYISPEYEQGFRLECQAIRKVREEFGLTNVWVMLPFVRTIWELKRVKKIMASEGLVQGNNCLLYTSRCV